MNSLFKVGTPKDERQRRLREAMRSGLPELERSRLQFGKRIIEDERTGDFFTVYRGVIAEAKNSPAVAYFVNDEGDPVFLERHAHARTVEELEAKREKAAQARAERMKPEGAPMITLRLPPHFLTTASYWHQLKNPFRNRVEVGGYLVANPATPEHRRLRHRPRQGIDAHLCGTRDEPA